CPDGGCPPGVRMGAADMVTRRRCETGTLAVTFERDGEPPEVLQATDGRQAAAYAVRLLLEHRRLRPGDRLTIGNRRVKTRGRHRVRSRTSHPDHTWRLSVMAVGMTDSFGTSSSSI